MPVVLFSKKKLTRTNVIKVILDRAIHNTVLLIDQRSNDISLHIYLKTIILKIRLNFRNSMNKLLFMVICCAFLLSFLRKNYHYIVRCNLLMMNLHTMWWRTINLYELKLNTDRMQHYTKNKSHWDVLCVFMGVWLFSGFYDTICLQSNCKNMFIIHIFRVCFLADFTSHS